MAFTTNYSNIQEYQEFKEQFYEFIDNYNKGKYKDLEEVG